MLKDYNDNDELPEYLVVEIYTFCKSVQITQMLVNQLEILDSKWELSKRCVSVMYILHRA